MSLLNDLKKVFFGAKAVATSAADKAAEAAKEATGELRERSAEWVDTAREEAVELSGKAKEALGDLKDKIWEETSHAVEKGREMKDQAENWIREKTETPPPTSHAAFAAEPEAVPTPTATSATTKLTSGPIDFEADLETPPPPKEPGALAQAGDQILDQAARAGAQALETAKDLGAKVMGTSEEIGSVLLEKGGDALLKAQELGSKIWDKADDLVARAQEEASKENLQDATAKAEELNRLAQERADNAVKDSKSSLLDGKDDFFSKAERFARGEYHDTSLTKDPNYKAKEKPGKAAGFDDHDGDGNELIDDAIIDED